MQQPAVYVDDVTVKHPETGEEHVLHVWMNPETKLLVAVDNMELPAGRNSILDPYDQKTVLFFHDTFTGLPK